MRANDLWGVAPSGLVLAPALLGRCSTASRFGIDDLNSILTTTRAEPRRANPAHSLQNGTRAWSQLGQPQSDHRPNNPNPNPNGNGNGNGNGGQP